MEKTTIDGVVTLPGKTQMAHHGDAGIDVFYAGDDPVILQPLGRASFDTGVVAEFVDDKHCIMVCPRSGLAFNNGITVLNAPGIVDSGFSGSIAVCLVNLSNDTHMVRPGDKIAQLVVMPNCASGFATGGELRGDNGFGSSGS